MSRLVVFDNRENNLESIYILTFTDQGRRIFFFQALLKLEYHDWKFSVWNEEEPWARGGNFALLQICFRFYLTR